MRRRLGLVAFVALLAMPASATGAVLDAPAARDTVPLFAAGGSAVTNGFFFPGTAVYDGSDLQGVPYEIAQGTDIEFTTPDGSLTLGNGHQIRSYKRRKNDRPLFMSKFVAGPGSTVMITSHLKPGGGELPDGSYGYFCTVHTAMYGMLKVVP